MLFIIVSVYLLADYCNCLENVNATTTTGLKVYLSQIKLLSFAYFYTYSAFEVTN